MPSAGASGIVVLKTQHMRTRRRCKIHAFGLNQHAVVGPVVPQLDCCPTNLECPERVSGVRVALDTGPSAGLWEIARSRIVVLKVQLAVCVASCGR